MRRLQGKLNNPKEEDIRAKILRHGNAADKSSAPFSKAYEKTQPTRKYAEPDEEEEEQKSRAIVCTDERVSGSMMQ